VASVAEGRHVGVGAAHRANCELYVSGITFSGDWRHRFTETGDIRLLHGSLAFQLRPRFNRETTYPHCSFRTCTLTYAWLRPKYQPRIHGFQDRRFQRRWRSTAALNCSATESTPPDARPIHWVTIISSRCARQLRTSSKACRTCFRPGPPKTTVAFV
jgi:hypothetical protein